MPKMNNLVEKYLGEAKKKFNEGDIVANKKTGIEFKVIENNGQGGIYCRTLDGKSGTWFRETDMTLLKGK